MSSFTVRGRRCGRIAAGMVLIAGAVLLATRLWVEPEPAAARTLLSTWAAAALVYVAAALRGSRRTLAEHDELEVAGWVLPSVGMALLLPLTLHLPFVAAVDNAGDGFDFWAKASGVITGATHVVLALLVALRASQLARGQPAVRVLHIYWICVAVSCVPFAIWILPPIFVAVTGIPLLVPLAWMPRLVESEREKALSEVVPHAQARIREG